VNSWPTAVILLAVLAQDTTLGPLLLWLDLVQPDDDATHEATARQALMAAELQTLEARVDDVMDGPIARDVRAEPRAHTPWAGVIPRGDPAFAELQAGFAIQLKAKKVSRRALLTLRREHVVPELILHRQE